MSTLHYCAAVNPDSQIYRDVPQGSSTVEIIQHEYYITPARCIDLWIEFGGNINDLDDYGTSALTIATALKNKKTVIKLLKAGADPNLHDNSISAYEKADHEIKSFFKAKGFIENEKSKALVLFEKNMLKELANKNHSLLDFWDTLTTLNKFIHVCKWLGVKLKETNELHGEDNIANFKMSLIEVGKNPEEGMIQYMEDFMQAMGQDTYNELTVLGANAKICYNWAINMLD